MNPIWTFLPGLHGNTELFTAIQNMIPSEVDAEFIELPSEGKQDYVTLSSWLNDYLSASQPRLIIAESFSGPLALRLAAREPTKICGVVLAASFCDAPVNPGIALLPLRPLFMVKPTHKALRHFLIGDNADEQDVVELRKVVQKTRSSTLANRVRVILELQEQDNPTLTKTPILLLQAQNDNLIPWDAQQRLEACYPRATVHWLESPHLILQQHPQQCLDAIQEFLTSLDKKESSPPASL